MRHLKLILTAAILGVLVIVACGGDGDVDQSGTSAKLVEQPADSLPTPGPDGTYSDLTFAQAQQLTPFELVMPGRAPVGYEFEAAGVAPPSENGSANATTAGLRFRRSDGAGGFVSLEESSANLQRGGGNSRLTELTILGITVERYEMKDRQPLVVSYFWQDDGIGFVLTAALLEPLSLDDLENMIAATIKK